MAKNPAIDELAKLVKELQSERQSHLDAIARIDETFEQFGISAQATGGATAPARGRRKKTTRRAKATSKPAAKRGRPVGSKNSKKKKRRGGRRRFAQTGEESVAAFVAEHGNPNTREVNEHWRKEGRGGKADNTLGKLIREGRLKRVNAKGERGSRYKTA